jgi:hypothetical protein
MPEIEQLLSQFPKERPSLSPDMAAAHMDILKANRERRYFLAKISNFLESWMHRQAAGKRNGHTGDSLLEIGAGTLNHVPYEDGSILYDAIEPFRDLYLDKSGKDKIRTFYTDISEVDPAQTYDRIVSVATLEHLTDLPYSIAKSGLLLNEGGVFQSGIPSEGGLLWGLSWRFTTAVAFYLKTGLAFSDHMRYEHVNDAKEIISILKYFYETVRISRFPLPSHHLSLYVYLEAKDPNVERCRDFLTDHAGA